MTNATTRSKVTQRSTAAGMLEFFYERFDMAHASDSELQFLADCSDTAAHMASSLALLAEGIGYLIVSDRAKEAMHSAALQGDDQPDLLFHIAQEASVIGRTAFIASESEFMLRQRLLDRLKVERSRRDRNAEYSSQGVSNG